MIFYATKEQLFLFSGRKPFSSDSKNPMKLRLCTFGA